MHKVLTVPQVASWALDLHNITSSSPRVMAKTDVVASIPVLQRGLVWKPHQVELLWDSLLRGFPIGSFVVSRRIEGQLAEPSGATVSHHLLDGQQRYNTIALGFTDNFNSNASDSVQSALWIDLAPAMAAKSTRDYLVRLTTSAHPWGYQKNDGAARLSAGAIRKSLPKEVDPETPEYKNIRPGPLDIGPTEATAPVPLSWLLLAGLEKGHDAADGKIKIDAEQFWTSISHKLDEQKNTNKWNWAERSKKFLVSSEFDGVQKGHILSGVNRVLSGSIVLLEAPAELLEHSSQQEKGTGHSGPDSQNIASIEHLFQRLNRLGTPLSGEELAYSMIKAYWPEVRKPLDKVENRRIPNSRLASLAARAAFVHVNPIPETLPAPLSVSRLRAIASGKNREEKSLIENYFSKTLVDTSRQIDNWLLYDKGSRPYGILDVHLTDIARRRPDIYLLFLCFASRLQDDKREWSKTMTGIATLLAWFTGKAKNCNEAVRRLYCSCKDDLSNGYLSIDSLRYGILEALERGLIKPIPSPENVREFLPNNDEINIAWTWGNHVDAKATANNQDERRKLHLKWDGFLNFRHNKNILLYVQRKFIYEYLNNYDPARSDLWEDHNRPWDFDHILPKSYLHNRKHGNWRNVCNQWRDTIANLRAWPFEKNRSDGRHTANEKISGKTEMLESFLDGLEIEGFSGGDKVRNDDRSAGAFIGACRSRLLRIYTEWYTSLEIGRLTEGIGLPGSQ